MGTDFNERSWLSWLAKVRIIIITFLLAIELAVVNLAPGTLQDPVRTRDLFVLLVLLWYTISVFYVVLLKLWQDTRLQGRLQILSDLAFATCAVYVSGGVDTNFQFLYPLIIVVACILLPRSWAYLIAALAFILHGVVLELVYFGFIRAFTVTRPELKTVQAIIFINFFAYLALTYLGTLLVTKLRQADVQLQDKSSALESLQALHQNIIDSISGGLITTSLDNRVTLINAAGLRLLECDEELIGTRVEHLFLDRLPQVGDESAHGEVRSRMSSGRQKTFSMAVSPLIVPDRGTLGYVYVFDDLTRVRRLEREVRMRERLAAVGRLAAGIAHEIRNPLSSIAGSVKVLAELSALNEEQMQLVRIVTRESERLNTILSNFLTYARERRYEFTTLDLVPLLEDTLSLLRNQQQATPELSDGRRVEIVRLFDVPYAYTLGEADRIKQVFWNICDNAFRAMPDGGTLTVSLEQARERWKIAFADTGPGLAPHELERIFEPFHSGFEGGTGLGLAIVYQIVQAHEGSISVRSSLGRGTEFVLELKRVAEPIPAAETAVAGKESRG